MSKSEVSRSDASEWARKNIWRLAQEGAKSGYEYYLAQLPSHERREAEKQLLESYNIEIVRR